MRRAVFLACALALAPLGLGAQDRGMLDYTPPDARSWTYLSDQVMGGVSEGRASIGGPPGAQYLRLTGDVSTKNRGGFIQVRVTLERPLPRGAKGVIIATRGNGEGYFVHLRTNGTVLPWQYYQAAIPSGSDWQEIRLPFKAFRPSGRMLRNELRPERVTSLGAVAYGRDHVADLSFRWIGVF
ncbi:Complex I intermediate-associated protein 30 (CIA30) [Roseovarius marisflavi]|uniref:Complex I intermediate-associated protein 30 (CIA30) n=1 Tax=Roseovarius marisflavi TaxID=1054996 RepID=A0A1M6WCC7_9RHOB|nr:CIA30 family protein [Roseovarius marisflavi]SHK91473.1 Complex I intermediate-associated protein 30 (CIA30) [Roseovarius marisflavi]